MRYLTCCSHLIFTIIFPERRYGAQFINIEIRPEKDLFKATLELCQTYHYLPFILLIRNFGFIILKTQICIDWGKFNMIIYFKEKYKMIMNFTISDKLILAFIYMFILGWSRIYHILWCVFLYNSIPWICMSIRYILLLHHYYFWIDFPLFSVSPSTRCLIFILNLLLNTLL